MLDPPLTARTATMTPLLMAVLHTATTAPNGFRVASSLALAHGFVVLTGSMATWTTISIQTMAIKVQCHGSAIELNRESVPIGFLTFEETKSAMVAATRAGSTTKDSWCE